MKWDKGVDFNVMRRKLERALTHEKNPKRRAYTAILLIQLMNGCRISEAVRAYRQYCKNHNHRQTVLVSKKKKPEKRDILVPSPVVDHAGEICVKELLKLREEKLIDRVKHYALNNFGINTHSLRYAFITHLLEQNISPSIIAKITKHSKLEFILTYTQEKKAKEILESLY